MKALAAALVAASLLAVTHVSAQSRGGNVPPPPAVKAVGNAQKIGAGFSTIGSAASNVGKLQQSLGNAANAQGDSLLDFSGDGTRGNKGVSDGLKNQRLGNLVGAGGSAITTAGNVINAADACYRGDSAAVVDHSSQALSNLGAAVGGYALGVSGLSKASGAAGRVAAGIMQGDDNAAATGAAETMAYGASCAAGWMGGGGPGGCDRAVDAADMAIDYGNKAVGYGIDEYFERRDRAILENSDAAFASMRAHHAVSAHAHAETNDEDARFAAAQAAQAAEAQAFADYDAQIANGRTAQFFQNLAGQPANYTPHGDDRGGASVGGCHPGHDETAHSGGCHEAH